MSEEQSHFELIRRSLDGEANDRDLVKLEQLLQKDEAFRKEYLRYLNVDSVLSSLPHNLREHPGFSADILPQVKSKSNETILTFPKVTRWTKVAIAVLLVCGALVVQEFNQITNDLQHIISERNPVDIKEVDNKGVAVMTQIEGLLGESTKTWHIGDTINPGTMSWDKGHLQLEFYSGATLVVEGPADIDIIDEFHVVCRLGRLRAQVPEQAHGFAILAPAFELVDLGTEFGLNIGVDGVSEVHVFDGKVEIYDPESNRSLATRRELNAGDAVTIGRDGGAKTMAARDTEFVTPVKLNRMVDVRRQNQHRDWQSFRDSLRDDPRVVAYFPFDQSMTKDRLLIGTDGHDSTMSGAIVGCEWSEGRWPDKQSLQFKRPSDRVRVSIPGEFDSLTCSVWLRVDGLDRTHHSLLLTDGYGKNGIHWQIRQNGDLVLGMRDANNKAYNYSSASIFNLFRLGQWVHLATVYDAEQKRVTHYVNGLPAKVERLKHASSGSLKIGNATIGNWSNPSKRHQGTRVRNFNGCIDELIVFGEALDDQGVYRIYEAGRP